MTLTGKFLGSVITTADSDEYTRMATSSISRVVPKWASLHCFSNWTKTHSSQQDFQALKRSMWPLFNILLWYNSSLSINLSPVSIYIYFLLPGHLCDWVMQTERKCLDKVNTACLNQYYRKQQMSLCRFCHFSTTPKVTNSSEAAINSLPLTQKCSAKVLTQSCLIFSPSVINTFWQSFARTHFPS